jgi:hypothetical protein
MRFVDDANPAVAINISAKWAAIAMRHKKYPIPIIIGLERLTL